MRLVPMKGSSGKPCLPVISFFLFLFFSFIPFSNALSTTRVTAQACSFGTDWVSYPGFQVIAYSYPTSDGSDISTANFMAYSYTKYGSLTMTSSGVTAPTLSYTSKTPYTTETLTSIYTSTLCSLGSSTCSDPSTVLSTVYSTTKYISTFGMKLNIQIVTLVFTGYFKADQTGIYTFALSQVDDAAMVWIGEGGFDCCTGDIDESSATNYIMYVTKTYNGATASLKSFVYLSAGYYYPMRITYVNEATDARLSFTITMPNGDIVSDYSTYIFQMSGSGNCGAIVVSIPTITSYTSATGLSTATKSYTTYTANNTLTTGEVVVVYLPYSTSSTTSHWTKSTTSTYTTLTTLTNSDGSLSTEYDVIVNIPYSTTTTYAPWTGTSTSSYTTISTFDDTSGTTFTDVVIVIETPTVPPTTTTTNGSVATTFVTATTVTSNGSTYSTNIIVVQTTIPMETTTIPGSAASSFVSTIVLTSNGVLVTTSEVVYITATIPPATIISTGPSASLYTIATTTTDANGNSYSTNVIVTETPYPTVTTAGASESTWTTLTTYDEGSTTYTGTIVVVETATIPLSTIGTNSANGNQTRYTSAISVGPSSKTIKTTDPVGVHVQTSYSQFSRVPFYQNSSTILTTSKSSLSVPMIITSKSSASFEGFSFSSSIVTLKSSSTHEFIAVPTAMSTTFTSLSTPTPVNSKVNTLGLFSTSFTTSSNAPSSSGQCFDLVCNPLVSESLGQSTLSTIYTGQFLASSLSSPPLASSSSNLGESNSANTISIYSAEKYDGKAAAAKAPAIGFITFGILVLGLL